MPELWRGVIREYRDRLPVTDATPVVTLREGGTPLVRSPVISEMTGLDVWCKYEGANPTGSFKDRGMSLAISKALEEGAKAVCCASTGNTSASAAAYATRAGLRCIVLIPSGGVAMGKLAQALIHGAEVLEVETGFDGAFTLSRDLATQFPLTFVNSVNPYRIEGQKTCAFEIVDDLGAAPDYHVLPVGNAGNITAQWKGYTEYGRGRPKMFGVQAEGAAPFIRGEPVEQPSTIASAIRIGSPQSWSGAVAATGESGGGFLAVSDHQILEAYHVLASREGLFCEPASAASLAGLLRLVEEGLVERGRTCVLVLTGNGLKDPDRALAEVPAPKRVPADVSAVAGALGW
ncbi:MAG TPA: threonine synthase [Actinomycetota bacterium]|nr:threonine synthase [Actinomycetota bacterium]